MKNSFLLTFLFFLFVATSCNSYGDQIKINDSLEIYKKGDNVTTDEVKKLGNYLADLWKDAPNEKSLQLSKSNDTYIVKMVVDEEKLKADPSLEEAFAAVRTLLQQEVFTNQKVNFVITDNHFKDIKTYTEQTTN